MSALRVYVSSTYQDLKHCRSAIRLALQRLGVDDIAMETYTAGEERPLDRCLEDVRTADIYVGVLAWRYGFVPARETASITELEYRTAGEAGVPRLMFVLDPDAPWPRSAMDRDSALIDAFRDHVLDTHVCDTFVAVDDLRAKVAEAVGRHVQERHQVAVGSDVAWDAYCTRLVQEYRRLDLEALTPPDRDEHLQIALRDVFVEPDVREDMPDTELPKELLRKLAEEAAPASSELPRGLDRDLVEQTRDSYRRQPARSAFDGLTSPLARTCVLLGDPGAGKSTLARYLVLALAEQRTEPALAAFEGWRPILIELRDYALKCDDYETFGSYLDYRKRTDGLGIEESTVETYLREDGRALVVFDGLDEIFEPRLRETVSRRIAGFATQFPAARVIVTSRVVGYRPRVFRGADFVQYTVQDLDAQKIDVFLRRWYKLALHDRLAAIEVRRERLTRAINDSAPIRELAGNPLLLTILAIIGKHQELPRERWKVYDHAASVLVQHWDVNKHLVDEDIDADVIREDDKKELLRKLAIRMQVGSHGFAGNSLLESDLLQDIEGYLVERFRYEPAKAAAISTAMVKQLRERNFIFARYGSGVYGFVHRALLEFFSAGDVVNRFEKAQTLSEDDLVDQVILPRSEDPAWAEVLRLIVGMVDATVATRLVDRLLRSTGTHRSSALDRRPLAVVALAAQCIAEIRNVNAAASAAEETLRAIVELLESPTRSFGDDVRESHLEKTVLPALNAVSAWPGRAAFRDWFVRRGRYASTTPAAKLGARFLAALFQNDDHVRDLLHEIAHSGIPQQREAAFLGIAQSWKTAPETIALVAKGLSDEEAFVRRTCLDVLVTNWPDDRRTHDLMLHAAKDADADVRSRAIEALAQHADEVPAAWPTVTGALLGDASRTVRDAAVTALAVGAADPRNTMALLLRACGDPAWQVRRSALRSVVARFATDPAVFARVCAAARDSDQDVRQAAVELLAGRWPDDVASVDTAKRAIRDADPSVRLAAVRVMAQRWHDDPEVVDVLKHAQNDYDGDVRVAALTVWSDPIGHPGEYVAILESVVAEDPVADARRAALETLLSNFAEYGGPALDLGITDPSPEVRSAALRSLSGVTPGLSDFLPAVLRLCEDAAESVRRAAVEVAARFWGDRPETVRILHRAARSRFWKLRRSALESLASRWPDEPETVRALHGGRRDPIDLVRYAATTMSASLASGTEELTAVIDAAIYDPDTRLRSWAGTLARAVDPEALDASTPAGRTSAIRRADLYAAARSEFGEGAAAAVRAAADDPDPDVRLAAAEVVGARRDAVPDALSLVVRFSRDEDPDVRWCGLAVLLAAWPDHDETSNARGRGLTDPLGEIRRLALESLILTEPDAPAVRRAVTAAMTDTEWTVRRLATDTLCLRWHDEPETRSRLQAALRHPEQNVRQAAGAALRGAYPDEESTFTSLMDCARDPAPSRRVRVLRDLATSRPHDSRVRDLLAIGRHDHEPAVAVAAWELQRGAADGNAFEETCRAADLRHPDVVARQLGADRLARLRSITDDDEDLFRIGIRDTSDSVRSTVQFALTSIADEHRVKSVLRNAGHHPNFRARAVGLEVRAARCPGSAESDEAIRIALADFHYSVRYTALNLLVESRPVAASSFDTVTRMLGDGFQAVRSSAIRIVSAYHPDDPKTVRTLSSACHDLSWKNRQAALDALLVGWPRHASTIKAVEEAETDVVWSVREFARHARMRLRPEVLSAAATTANPRSTAMARVRDCDLRFPDVSTSRQVVLDSTASADWQVRYEALRVLARRWPEWPATELAFSRSAMDENEHVREVVTRRLVEVATDSRARVAVLRRAVLGPGLWERHGALALLALWRTPETQELLLEAARDRELHVHNEAIQLLLACWPVDDRTRDVLGWAVCSSFEWLHHMARERLSSNEPVRAVSLTTVLGNTGATPETRSLLLSAVHDVCPAVRRLAFQGLAQRNDPAWIDSAITDPDPYLRFLLCCLRSVTDPSPRFSAELVQALHDEPDDSFSRLMFRIAAIRAGAGLLEPAALADATRAASYYHPVTGSGSSGWCG